MGKEIKGENERYKREILREERGLLILEILEKLRKRKGTRREKKERRKRESNPSQNQHPLEKRKEILHSKEFSYSNHL